MMGGDKKEHYVPDAINDRRAILEEEPEERWGLVSAFFVIRFIPRSSIRRFVHKRTQQTQVMDGQCHSSTQNVGIIKISNHNQLLSTDKKRKHSSQEKKASNLRAHFSL